MAIDPPPVPREDDLAVALAALSDASTEAIEAWSAHQNAERRWEQARDALVACYRDTGLLAIQGGYPVGLPSMDEPDEESPPGTPEASEPVPVSAPLEPPGRSEPIAAGGGPAVEGLTKRQAEVLAVVRRHNGNRRAAADELRCAIQSVEIVLEAIGKRGLLPATLIPKLPARFARYTGI